MRNDYGARESDEAERFSEYHFRKTQFGAIEEIALYMDDSEKIIQLTDDSMSGDGAVTEALIGRR